MERTILDPDASAPLGVDLATVQSMSEGDLGAPRALVDELGLAAHRRGDLTLIGVDPVIRSPHRLGEASAIAQLLIDAAATAIWQAHVDDAVPSTVLAALQACDVAIVGETSEFDTFEYVRDANALGIPKAVIRIAHERLEEWGMEDFATWLRPVAAGVPAEWIPTGDPFSAPH